MESLCCCSPAHSAGVFVVGVCFLVLPDAFNRVIVGGERLEELGFGESVVIHLEGLPDVGARDKLLLAMLHLILCDLGGVRI